MLLNKEETSKWIAFLKALNCSKIFKVKDKNGNWKTINVINDEIFQFGDDEISISTDIDEIEISTKIDENKFTKGDILFVSNSESSYIIVLSEISENGYYIAKTSFDIKKEILHNYKKVYCNLEYTKIRFATEKEKSELFKALEKDGKRWNSGKKIIETIYSFKPFDRVIMKASGGIWSADLFSHIDEENIYWGVGSFSTLCVPYNKETEKLIGTANDYEQD